jgi:hypothetical protein
VLPQPTIFAELITDRYPVQPNEIPCPTWKDTAIIQAPVWMFNAVTGRIFGRNDQLPDLIEIAEDDTVADAGIVDDEESDVGKKTPSTDSAEDFELLEKSVDDLGGAKTSGSQKPGAAKKRKNKKR